MTDPVFEARLLALAETAGAAKPTPFQLDLLWRYYALLRRWNERINLTALPLAGFPDATLNRLLVEPLIAVDLVGASQRRWLDLGSGGGTPAIPIKIMCPHLHLVLVESRARKAAFLSEAVREVELEDVEVLNQRFEDLLPAQSHQADLVTVRAVRADAVLQTVAKDVLKADGHLLFFGAPREIPGFRAVAERPLPGPPSHVRDFVVTEAGIRHGESSG